MPETLLVHATTVAIGDQRPRSFGERIDPQNPDAAGLDKTGDRRRRAHENHIAVAAQFAAVIGDEARSGVD
jgi:hypothetical protein